MDDSSKHSGHAAMMIGPGKAGSSGETHFKVSVVSASFEGMNQVGQQGRNDKDGPEEKMHGLSPRL